ncbi:hypothetical protein BKG93_02140 [Rodentibacter ratti]|uniref:DUF805 domain-containing protein n=1 Tax=Rodentibacter ratti TaxID=1906745 RepID=A0A1V3LA35_9PAST|nr:DUF805 domain-containing protein [Rodentibacter ratti]OOF86684.1 hypothetical protein BKG93_02140 [Rodentibacter ratti]OOF89143.1 hypothetical protein BKG94_04170 [Rodentibacter ratti]
MNWYLSVLKNYATFSGRARRKEYWMFCLFSFIISIALSILDGIFGLINYETGLGVLSGLYTLAVFIPALAVSVRRLHDTNRSGWWLLINFIPLVGFIIFLVFMCLDSKTGDNKYGAYPKG